MVTSTAKTVRLAIVPILLLMFALAVSADPPVKPNATVTAATGGEAISADTTGGAYTILTGPVIQEGNDGQVGTGTIILEVPSGFEFDPAAPVSVLLIGHDNGNKNINNAGNGTIIPATSVNATQIIFTVTEKSENPAVNTLTFVNIGVRPAAGTPLAHGTISKSGTSIITGIANGYAMGYLNEVAGAVATIIISPDTATINQWDAIDYSAAGYDAFGNSLGVVTSTTVFGINASAGGYFSGNTYNAQYPGIWTVNGTNGAAFDTATLTVRDITPPVITINGSAIITIEVGSTYTDEGATALDNVDGDLTSSIITVGVVDSRTVGTYTVTYSATDAAGNTGTALRIVNVVDTTPPVITVAGANPISVHYGDSYVDDGATALDNYDNDITGAIVTVNNVNTSLLGLQVVTYDVNDSSGNSAHDRRNVTVIDEEIPIITMLGSSPVSVPINTPYVDDGATALDNADGDITGSIVTNSNVNTSTIGTYSVTYDVSDSSGNIAMTVTRVVNVVDVTPPVITLLGNGIVYVEKGTPYNDEGATAIDDIDEDLTASIIVVNPVDPYTLGTYTVIYNVSDAAGNTAQETRTVIVQDTIPPALVSADTQDADSDGMIDSILLTFNESIGDEYLNIGAPDNWDVDGYDNEQIGTGTTANDTILVLTFDESDSNDTGATPAISYLQLGSPTSTHDLAGNELASLEITTTDGAKPILKLNGDNPMTITAGGAFTDPGANATEEGIITTTGTVDTNTAGTYYITYTMTDNAGNKAANVTRTVNVVNPAPTGGGGGGGGGGTGGQRQTPTPQATGGQAFTFPSLPLVTGGGEIQAPQTPETGNPAPTGETPTAEVTEPIIPQPQATGIFNLNNNRMKLFGIGLLLLLLLALGAYGFHRMRKNKQPV